VGHFVELIDMIIALAREKKVMAAMSDGQPDEEADYSLES
jgi:hypothetical protein